MTVQIDKTKAQAEEFAKTPHHRFRPTFQSCLKRCQILWLHVLRSHQKKERRSRSNE